MRLLRAIPFIACLPAFGALAADGASRFEGQWADPQSNTIASVGIRNLGGTLRAHVFGACHPRDCDWGEAVVRAYAATPDPKRQGDAEVLSVEYLQGFARTLIFLYAADGDRLRVETFTVFTDSSGRLPIHKTQLMERSAAQPEPGGDPVLPVQLSPPSGSVFSAYPRSTTLDWTGVPGAARYGIEVDCFECCQPGQWCSDVGGKTRTAFVNGLTYTFNFVGAQPGRWRVWAVGQGGVDGPKTDWWNFRYTQ